METISQVLFWVANSLLIPDIILLLLLFIRSLLLIGGVYNQYMTKRKNDKQMNRLIKELTPDTIGELKGALIGTLIAMSPALVGLSTGDIAGMAYNMQVVFATTVVGLVVSAVGLVSLQFKQRWYAKDVNNLDYVARKLNEKNTEA